MPAPQWDTNWKPRREGSRARTIPRIQVIEFEDYEQRIRGGIRNLRKEFPLTFREHYSLIDAMEAFLEARGGSQSFMYVDETTGGDVTYRVVCDQPWDRMPGRGANEEILQVTFREVPLEWP